MEAQPGAPRAEPLGIVHDLWTRVQLHAELVLTVATKNDYKYTSISVKVLPSPPLATVPKAGPLQLHTLATPQSSKRDWPGVHSSWNVLCEACTDAGGEVQLYGDTRGVTVKLSGCTEDR